MATDPAKIHFFDLPSEIRNNIYKYCFGDLAFHYCSPDFIKDARRFTNTRWSTTLFSVNHQVRQEALSAFSDNLTVYCDYNHLTTFPLTFPKFILANLTKLVVCEASSQDIAALQSDVELWRKAMPKLETFSILQRYPIRNSHEAAMLTTLVDVINFLRGGIDKAALFAGGYMEYGIEWHKGIPSMMVDNFRLIWKVEPGHYAFLKHLNLKNLYRIDYAPATRTVHTRRINVSQSRSYLFGTWVPAEDVMLLIDEVSFPVVWSVKHNMGRVLTTRYDIIERMEKELQDPRVLARALEKGFNCGEPYKQIKRRLVSIDS